MRGENAGPAAPPQPHPAGPEGTDDTTAVTPGPVIIGPEPAGGVVASPAVRSDDQMQPDDEARSDEAAPATADAAAAGAGSGDETQVTPDAVVAGSASAGDEAGSAVVRSAEDLADETQVTPGSVIVPVAAATVVAAGDEDLADETQVAAGSVAAGRDLGGGVVGSAGARPGGGVVLASGKAAAPAMGAGPAGGVGPAAARSDGEAAPEIEEAAAVSGGSTVVRPDPVGGVAGSAVVRSGEAAAASGVGAVVAGADEEAVDETQVVIASSASARGDSADATQVVAESPGDQTTRLMVVPKVERGAVDSRDWDRHLRDCLRREFGSRVAVSGAPLGTGVRLAVVRGEDSAFERVARAAKVRAVTVAVEGGVIELGPLAVPGQPGCAACARARRTAAAAGRPPTGDPDATEVVRAGKIPAAAVGVFERMLRAAFEGDKALAGYVVEIGDGEPLWHKVIPLPECASCGGADGIATVGLPDDEDDPEALLEALAGWVDPLTGVIPWISVSEPLPGGPYVGTAAPPHVVVGPEVRAMPIGWGKGMTRHGAIMSAVGEAIERYSASLPDPDRIVWARAADLEGEVLDPREFPLYEPDQYTSRGFPYAPYDRRIDHPWVRGTWLGTDKPVWVPAVFSYLAMGLLQEHLICQGTSNGLAAGTDADSAAVCATLELIERDAMMSAWLTGAKGRYVELDDTLDIEVVDVIEALREAGPAVEVYVLPTSAYGTTAVALAIGDGRRWPAVSVGLGADRSPRGAIRSAVLELAQTAPHLAGLLREGHRPPRHAGEVREMLDHAAYYFPTSRMEAFDRLRCGGTSHLADLPEPAFDTSVTDLAGHLGSAGIRVAVVDVTSADVATSPLRVVRAVSPDLQPISYGHGVDRLPVARLRHRGAPIRRLVHPIW